MFVFVTQICKFAYSSKHFLDASKSYKSILKKSFIFISNYFVVAERSLPLNPEMLGILLLLIAAGIGYIVYQKYANEAATSTDPAAQHGPKPSTSALGETSKASESKQSPSAAAPLAKSRLIEELAASKTAPPPATSAPPPPKKSPRPIQVITIGIGGDELPPGVVQEEQVAAPAALHCCDSTQQHEKHAPAATPTPASAPKPAPAPQKAAEKPKEESSSRDVKTANEPSEATQDSGADKPIPQPSQSVSF